MPAPSSAAAPDTTFLRGLAGRFIVFDGPDGSGKSTQFRRFSRACAATGLKLCEVRDPGGTPIGEKIRDMLLDRAHTGMGVTCETLLYMASRAELVEQRIVPALSRGEMVLSDRFVSSTLAYQGAAGGIPASEIAAVARMATRNLQPDLVLIFDIDEAAAARRLSPLLDRMEAKGAAFHRKVRQGYLDLVRTDPGRYAAVDASKNEEGVWAELLATVKERMGQFAPR